MVLGKRPVPRRPTNLDNSSARALQQVLEVFVCLDIFLSSIISSLLSPSLCDATRYRLKCCFKGPLN